MSFNVGAHESTGNANGTAEETDVNNLEHAAADNNAESILGAESVPSSESILDSEHGDSEARFVTAHSEIEDDDPDDSFYDAPEIGNDAIQLEVAAELDMNELEIAAPSDESEEDQIDEDIELDNFVIVNIPAGATDSDDSDDESTSDRDITYDRSMPSGHMYLGEDLEDVHGRTLFEEGAEVVLPAHSQFGIVLVPGQVMPLHLSDPDEVAMMRTAMEHQKAIAFLHQRRRRQGGMRLLGTTADILSINSDNPNDPTAMVKAITRGQQRFELIKLERQITGVRMARIRIMNETRCSEPLDTVIPASHRRQRVSGLVKPSRRVCVHNEPSYLTAWPPWVYTQYSPKVLMGRLKKEIKKQWGEQTFSSVENITSPDQLAFWVAENIPMSPKSKSYILQLTSNVQILRYELHLIQQFTDMLCSFCNAVIAKKSEVFSLSHEGPMGTYVNNYGSIHETLTVHKAKNLTLHGRPSREFSWFPGYAWTIANCRTCRNHKGWKFTSSSLQPKSFYGLTRHGLTPGLNSETVQHSGDGEVDYESFVI